MKMMFVQSSNLLAVGYDSGTLRIAFHSGGMYDYYNVPEVIYSGLMQAPSHGKYFWQHIRNIYPYNRIA